MSNPTGHPASLPAAPPGNTNNGRHGLYSHRMRDERAQAIADDLMALPHTQSLDRLAAEQVGREQALVERLTDLMDGMNLNRATTARLNTLADMRGKAEGRLARALREFGATPRSRAEFARDLGEADTLAARAAAIRAGRPVDADTTATEEHA